MAPEVVDGAAVAVTTLRIPSIATGIQQSLLLHSASVMAVAPVSVFLLAATHRQMSLLITPRQTLFHWTKQTWQHGS